MMVGAIGFGNESLEAKARETILIDANQVVNTIDFTRLDESNFVSFISNDEFDAKEINIFNACLKFAEIGNRSIDSLIPCVSLLLWFLFRGFQCKCQ